MFIRGVCCTDAAFHITEDAIIDKWNKETYVCQLCDRELHGISVYNWHIRSHLKPPVLDIKLNLPGSSLIGHHAYGISSSSRPIHTYHVYIKLK